MILSKQIESIEAIPLSQLKTQKWLICTVRLNLCILIIAASEQTYTIVYDKLLRKRVRSLFAMW